MSKRAETPPATFWGEPGDTEALRRYWTLVNTIDDGIYQLDAEGRFLAVNETIVEMTGYAREELLGEHVSLVLEEPDIARSRDAIRGLLQSEGSADVATLEFPIQTTDGDAVPCEIRLSIVEDDRGFQGTVGVVRDVSDRSDRRKLEEYETVVETIPDGAYALDQDHCFQVVNEAFTRMTGYSRDELIGSSAEIVSTDRGHERSEQLREQLRSGEIDVAALGERVQTADGGAFDAEIRFVPLPADDDAFRGTVGVVRDITERKRMEEELSERERQLSRLMDNVPGMVYRCRNERSWPMEFVSDASREVTGYEADAFERGDVRYGDDVVLDADRDDLWEAIQRDVNDREPFTETYRIETADGEIRWVRDYGRGIFDEDGELVSLEGIIVDITERKRLESELEEVFGRVTDAFYALDDQWRFTHVNEQAEELLRHSEEELLGENLWELFPEAADEPEVWDAFHTAVETQEPTRYDLFFEPLDFWVEATVYPSETGVSVYFRDITERRERERRLRESEQRYRTLAENFPNGIVTLFDHDLEYTLAAGQRFADIPPDPADVEGEELCNVWDADIVDALEPAFEAALDGDERSVQLEYEGREWIVHVVPITAEGGDVLGGMTMAQDITDRVEREQELAALNRLHETVRDTSLVAVESASRDEIEARVCEQLVETDLYAFAWIGHVDRGRKTVTPGAAAGVEDGYLEDVEITIDESETAGGPTGKAIRTGEPQFVQDLSDDPGCEHWREHARERGYRSSAAVPITHEGVTYGVLNVYADEPRAFEAPEDRMLAQLGELVGHAIYAVEQRKALVSDTATEIDLRIADADHPLLEAATGDEVAISFERRIPSGGETYVQFVTVRGMSPEEFASATAERESVRSVECISARDGESLFEITTGPTPIVEALASVGARIRETTVSGGAFRLVAEVPSDADVREVLESIRKIYPDTELLAQRTTIRDETSRQEMHAAITDRLTDKQRAALEAAYFAGYFEWPRVSNGEEVAELLNLSSPTFAEHIRAAQRQLFEALFESERSAAE